MSELRFELHKNDFLMNKSDRKLFFVIKIDLNNVWLRYEDQEGNDDAELFKVPKHLINLAYTKVRPDVVKILYGDRNTDETKNE